MRTTKRILLAASALTVLSVTAHAQSLIAPGQGTVTDANGTRWQIVADGSILQTAPNGAQTWTPGGGGTSALTIVNGTVYGQDARTQDWLTLSGQEWTPSAAPSIASTAFQAAGQSLTVVPTTGTPAVPVTSAVSLPPAAQAAQQIAAAPAPAAISAMASCATPTTAAGAGTGGFHVVNGQIIGPNGQPFVAKGINVGDTNFGDAQQMLTDFPGLNFVRVSDNAYSPPSTFTSFVSTMTSKGVVVEIEDHRASDGTGAGGEQGVVETGSTLAAEQAWFASLAQAFKGNPYVMLGTNNEPPGPGAALAQWIATTYQTVRSNGFTGLILMDAIGAFDTTGMPSNFAASFTNVAWDAHYYPWYYLGNGISAAQGLRQIVSSLQAIQSADGTIPVIVAEYGMCTSSGDTEQQGMDLVAAVSNSASTSPQTTSGSSAWHWGKTDDCNNLVFNGPTQPANDYTGAVAIYIGIDPTAVPRASLQTASAASCTTQQAVQSNTVSTAPAATVLAQTSTTAPAQSASDPLGSYSTQIGSDLSQAAANLDQAAQIAAQANNPAQDAQTAALIAAANARLAAVQALRQGAAQ